MATEDQKLSNQPIRYALYVRKSTDDPKKQARSIDDQKVDCEALAQQLHLKIVKRFTEKKSAKKPYKRSVFNEMLKGLEKKEFEGILAWHPDRLARNMREGGIIIDMIDDGIIKDLRFVMHHFTPDANGKMLLGMAFVLSKQYSDHLSENVTRGVRKKFEEGKSNIPKHGYKIVAEEYKPDGERFNIIKEAWQMRLAKKSYEQILEYLSSKKYVRKTAGERRGEIKISKQTLSAMFKDPFYYGKLIKKPQEVNLRDFYDFQPMITEEEYNRVQIQGRMTNFRLDKNRPEKKWLPFRALIYCEYCKKTMSPSINKGGSNKHYFNFQCGNKTCHRRTIKKSSTRGKILLQYVEHFFNTAFKFTEREYEIYKASFKDYTKEEINEIKSELSSKRAQLGFVSKEIAELSTSNPILSSKPNQVSRIAEEIQKKVEKLEKEETILNNQIRELDQKLKDPTAQMMSLETFLNFSKRASELFNQGNGVAKDAIVRIVFLNFSLDAEKVASIQLKRPFEELCKSHLVKLSWDNGTGTRSYTDE